MGFVGRKGRPDEDHPARTTALVVEAAVGLPRAARASGPGSNGPVRIVADLGSGPRLHDGKIRMTDAHWLVPGMDAAVQCSIRMIRRGGSRSIGSRCRPSRPAPRQATRRLRIRSRRGGRSRTHSGLPRPTPGPRGRNGSERALEQAASQPKPPGKLRAVALIATIRGRRRIVGDPENASTHDQVRTSTRAPAPRCSR